MTNGNRRFKGIKDVQEYLDVLVSSDTLSPFVKNSYILSTPGLKEDDCQHIEKKLRIKLPESYRKILKEYNLASLELGFLRFQPTGTEAFDLVRGIIEANDLANNPLAEFYASERLLEIAVLEADPVCIRLEGAEAGQVVWVRHDRVPLEEEFVTSDFECLLVCAATDFWKRMEVNYFDWNSKDADYQQRSDRLGDEIMDIIAEIEPRAQASQFWRTYIYY